MKHEEAKAQPAPLGQVERVVGRLPADVARCSGVEDDEGSWRDGCEDCMRRTDRSYFPQAAWMVPPALVVFECEARIAP